MQRKMLKLSKSVYISEKNNKNKMDNKIENLCLADLKAAYDFVLIDLKELEEKAKKEGVSVDKIGAYSEVVNLEGKLFDALLNKTRNLE